MLSMFFRALPIYYVAISAILGLSLAWLVTSEAQIKLNPKLAPFSSVAESTTDARRTLKPADNRIILQRNVFNSAHPAQAAQLADPNNSRATTKPQESAPSNLLLIGTAVAGDDSLAVISIDNVMTLVRLQGKVGSAGMLVAILRDQVEIISPDGTRQFLGMEDNIQTTTSAQTDKSSATPAPKTLVHDLGNNRWIIPASSAEMIRTDIASIAKQARITPNIVNGKTAGFRVQQIQRGTLLEQMGIKRGDILHAVNGITLDSPEKGLQIFQQLREAKTLSLDLQRADSSINFQYEVK